MEHIKEIIEERDWADVKPFLISIALLAIVGAVFESVTGLSSSSFKGVGYIIVYSLAFIVSAAIISKWNSDSAKYDFKSVIEEKEALALKYNKLRNDAQTLHTKAIAIKEDRDKQKAINQGLANANRTLKELEHSLNNKVHSLNTDLANANELLANAQNQVANAESTRKTAIANALANAKTPHLPYIELATLYAKDRYLMGIINNKSLDVSEHEKARGERSTIKERMQQLTEQVQKLTISF